MTTSLIDNKTLKNFKQVNIKDEVYYINTKLQTPQIQYLYVCKITGIKDGIEIDLYDHPNVIKILDVHKNPVEEGGKYFINKIDCQNEFEKICTERIILLAKALGSIKNGN